jgi:hypothetical protein
MSPTTSPWQCFDQRAERDGNKFRHGLGVLGPSADTNILHGAQLAATKVNSSMHSHLVPQRCSDGDRGEDGSVVVQPKGGGAAIWLNFARRERRLAEAGRMQ